ncbi:non-canonical purine NTP pyrophosphatase [Prevotella sp. DNF00663]|uniref:non-canonical purine NTP pyrophosphatase n=1 Tax=Prevotella sp. DNF00663 TaxID=1384078 RepID=UPI00351019A4
MTASYSDSSLQVSPSRGDLEGPIFFSGSVSGTIAHSKSGSGGFGYDPLFVPEGYDKSFAELGAEVKNKISHRARAVEKLAEYLHSLEE